MTTTYRRTTCRLCGGVDLELAMGLTPTPLCDAYVSADKLQETQEVYPLDLHLCRACGYVHLPYVVDPEIIYRNYIYVTTSSMGLSDHFRSYADSVLGRLKPPKHSLVVDIGSNDGTLLRCFKERAMRVLGVDPAEEIARTATDSGVPTLPDFFTPGLADQIRKDRGPASIVTVNNLFANVDNLEEMMGGISRLLSPGGVLVVESSYLGDMLQNMVFDFIYHEHLSYFSIKPLIAFFRRFNMELIDIEHIPTKGGSLRYCVQLNGGERSASQSVGEMVEYESRLRLDRIETYRDFSDRVKDRKTQLLDILHGIQGQGKTVAGYGGSATTTTLVYHFGFGSMMDYIVDDNIAKQNTYSPGYHIPVLSPQVIYERRPDYVIVLAWRYFEPIRTKHQRYLDEGGHFIIPLPAVSIT